MNFTIKGEWERYRREVLAAELAAPELEKVRVVFYAAFLAAMKIPRLMQKQDPRDAVEMMNRLAKEAEVFVSELKIKAATEDARN